MKIFWGFVFSIAVSFALMACSQSVTGSDSDGKGISDDYIPGFNPNKAGANSASSSNSVNGSPSSAGSSQSGFVDRDDGWGDDSGNSSGSSGLDVTKYVPNQKMDCKFSIDDDTWQIKQVEADSSIDMTIKFKDNMDLWVSIVSEGNAESEEECQQSAALLSVFGAMAAASDETDMTMYATCEGDRFKMTVQGTADEKYTPEQKREMYDKMCL